MELEAWKSHMPEINWEDIKYTWTNGNCTLEEKAIQYEISVAEILLYAKQNDWGERGYPSVSIDTTQDPDELIRQTTLANLHAIILRLNDRMTPKDHLDIQKAILSAKETLDDGLKISDKLKELMADGINVSFKKAKSVGEG